MGAHLHRQAEEFFILDGELDLLAFEPRSRAIGDAEVRARYDIEQLAPMAVGQRP